MMYAIAFLLLCCINRCSYSMVTERNSNTFLYKYLTTVAQWPGVSYIACKKNGNAYAHLVYMGDFYLQHVTNRVLSSNINSLSLRLDRINNKKNRDEYSFEETLSATKSGLNVETIYNTVLQQAHNNNINYANHFTLDNGITAPTIVFDGFSQNGTAITATHTTIDHKICHKLFLICKKNPSRLFNQSPSIIYKYEDYSAGKIDALSMYHENTHFIACSSGDNKYATAVCYQVYKKLTHNDYMIKKVYSSLLPAPAKKICMLSPSLSLFLTKENALYTLSLDLLGEPYYAKKNICDKNNQPITIKNFAVNALLPYLVLLLSTGNNLYLLNLDQKDPKLSYFTRLTHSIKTDHLWFYGEKFGYLDQDTPQTIKMYRLLYRAY